MSVWKEYDMIMSPIPEGTRVNLVISEIVAKSEEKKVVVRFVVADGKYKNRSLSQTLNLDPLSDGSFMMGMKSLVSLMKINNLERSEIFPYCENISTLVSKLCAGDVYEYAGKTDGITRNGVRNISKTESASEQGYSDGYSARPY